jgi:hypothetical protein
MNRSKWIAASLMVLLGLAAGCSGSSSTSAPKAAGTNSGPPKGGEPKANSAKSGIENPPPP